MAAIHVIYDPHDKISMLERESQKRLGLSVAFLSIPDVGITNGNIDDLVGRLTEMLLEQLRSDRK